MTDDIFDPIKESTIKHHRKAVRYTSGNCRATVTVKPLFMPRMHVNIKVVDISSKGARISSKYTFVTKTKITLNIKIKNHPPWKISARITGSYKHSEFGIAFDSIQHELIDQVMKNEDDFTVI